MAIDERNRKIRVYLNKSRTSKIPPDATEADWAKFHSRWRSAQLTAREMAIEIYRGHSIAHLHEGRKRKECWREAWYVALDFDTEDEKSSLDYLSEQEYIKWFASFAHTTPSHKEDAPRARVVWIFEEPISQFDEYEELYKAMLYHFPWADQSTKDPARFFYGAVNCNVWANWSIFPADARAHVLDQYRDSLPPPEPDPGAVIVVEGNGNYQNYIIQALENECDRIRTAKDGEKHDTRYRAAAAIGELVSAPWAELDWSDAFNSLMSAAMSNTKLSREKVEITIKDGLSRGMESPRRAPRVEVPIR
jgi:hypothetical protein